MGVFDRREDEGAGMVVSRMAGPQDRTGFFQNITAGYRAAQAGPGSTSSRRNAAEARYYDQIVRALAAEGEQGEDWIEVRPGGFGYTGPKNVQTNRFGVGRVPVKRAFRNPYTSRPSTSQADNPVSRLYVGGDRQEVDSIWTAVQRIRQRKPDFLKDIPNEAALAARATADRKRELASAQEITSRAGRLGTVGNFVGGMAGSIAAGDPENAIGGFGGATGKTAARTIIKRGLEGGAVNVVAGALALPGQMQDSERLGDEMTTGDAARSLAEQAAIGVLFGGGGAALPTLARGGKKIVAKGAGAVVDQAARVPIVRDVLAGASLRAGTVKDRGLLREYRRLHNPYDVGDTSTSDERAALHVTERDADVREASPLRPEHAGANAGRLDAIASALGVDMPAPEVPSAAPVQRATVRDRSGAPVKSYTVDEAIEEFGFSPEVAEDFVRIQGEGGKDESGMVEQLRKLGHDVDVEAIKPRLPEQQQPPARRDASYTEGLHRAEGTGKNPDSSASGHFQFTEGTWLEYAPKVTETAGMSRAQILALRNDRGIATRAEQRFRADNARYLRERGVEDSPGNLSLAHFLGRRDAAKVLRAAPGTPISQVVDGASIRANRNVFNKIKTADDMVAWAHRRIGATVDSPPARPDAVPEDEVDPSDLHPHAYATFRPDEVETDAALMQYKSDGDENGVTAKLREVTTWNPTVSSEIMVWETLDKRRVVVDGHQRTGLAKRLYPEDPSIELRAIVFREADGVTAAQARLIGALRNIALGTGSLVDNARVLRDAPRGAEMIRGAEHRREIEGLARLNYEAFGAVVNEVIDPRIAAEIGRNAGDRPDAHMAMVDLLRSERIHNRDEAGSIVRQALADGFGTAEAEQLGMFGDTPEQSLYVPIARILAAATKRLREEKRTFAVLERQAGRIQEAGNVLDRSANQERVVEADEAVTILDRTAYRSGPVRDALIAAARAELSGARRADAVGQFLQHLGGIDLRAAASGLEQGGGDGAGLRAEGSGNAAEAPDVDVPGPGEPSLFDEAVDASARAESFSDPVGKGAKAQSDLIMHDLLPEAIDPVIADRQRQEGQIKADSPMRSVEEQEGTMGLSLFDAADQPTFRLDEEGEARPLDDILREAEADEIAAKNAKDCLK